MKKRVIHTMPVLGEQGVQNASSYHDLFKIWKYFSKWSSFFKNQSCPKATIQNYDSYYERHSTLL